MIYYYLYQKEIRQYDRTVIDLPPYPIWQLIKGKHFTSYQQAVDAASADMIVVSSPVWPCYVPNDYQSACMVYDDGIIEAQVVKRFEEASQLQRALQR
ncbi:MAG TPA: hypothetical protein VFA10_30115 [Ktedonobacteraceae bacterium]|nr:hypothetical protein [Ktedonobacteraceae bacterium]